MIIDIEKDRQKAKQGKPKTRRKLEHAPQYQVIMQQEGLSRAVIPCSVCILQAVFNKSSLEASRHITALVEKGKEAIYVSSKEIAESKAEQANEARDVRAKECTRSARRLSFVVEQAPAP